MKKEIIGEEKVAKVNLKGIPHFNLQFFAEPNPEPDDEPEDDDIVDEPDDEPINEPKPPKVKTFTQDEVTRMLSNEKKQGKNSVYKALGIDPKDTKTINMLKAIVGSQKSKETIDNEQTEQLEQANHRAMVAEAKAEAMLLGAGKQYVDDVVTLALSKLEEDGDIKTVIGELKTKYPVWFDVDSDDDDDDGDDDSKDPTKVKKSKLKGTGSSVTTKAKKAKEGEQSLGARLAAKRTAKAKTSFWD